MKDRTFYFDITASGVAVFLGPTETRLMELVWKHGGLTVKQALLLLEDKPLAYTTVMTILGRLTEKKILTRDKQGHNYIYKPAMDRDKFVKEQVKRVTNCLERNFGMIR